MNRDFKIKGGIVGVIGMEGIRDRWVFIVYMMVVVIVFFKVMSGILVSLSCYKELGL